MSLLKLSNCSLLPTLLGPFLPINVLRKLVEDNANRFIPSYHRDEVDDLIQMRVNRIEFNHLIDNLDNAMEEKEAKEEEEVEEKVEKENALTIGCAGVPGPQNLGWILLDAEKTRCPHKNARRVSNDDNDDNNDWNDDLNPSDSIRALVSSDFTISITSQEIEEEREELTQEEVESGEEEEEEDEEKAEEEGGWRGAEGGERQ
ncbi:PREDICTED: KIN17-like protein [Atta colombica]|uniref:KIN17-like protein n=1 Tax=Atta colombica TaxID=520822 RepID=UPI00084C5C47|nr:PREDICTED: KIN17-like protein [Atta colombica]